MPKRQTQRIIDSRRRNSLATIIGATGSGVPVSLTAGDGLAITGTTIDVVAGDGVSVAADAVAVDSTVVRTTRTVTAGSGLTGGGALSSNLTLNVGAGTLITVGADTVGITTGANYQYIGTGSGTAAAWQNLSGLAGAGLTHSAGVLAVGAGSGITVNADDVALTTPGTLTAATSNTATGNHTHAITTGAASTLTVATSNATGSSASLARADHQHTITTSSNPGAAASILASDGSGYLSLVRLITSERLRTPLIDTVSGPLTLDPAGDVVSLAASTSVQTANYASQLTGWRATYAGEADFRYLFVDEMHAKSFVADLEQALAGGQIISKSVAVLATAFTAPSAGDFTALYVRDLPSAPNMACFQAGDIVRLRQFSRAGGSLSIADCWGSVTDYADGNGSNFAEGFQFWKFTRSAAPNAGAMAAGTVIQPDALVLDYGTSGNGYYEVNAIDGAFGQNSPYTRVATWTAHPATGTALRAQFGNLRGVYGYATTEFGVAMGSATGANVTVDATNGVRLRQGTTDQIVLDPAGGSYFAGVMTIGAAGEIRQGTGTLGSNFTGLRLWRDSSIGRIGGYNNNTLQWWGATDGKIYAGNGATRLDINGVSNEVGSTYGINSAYTFLSGGSVIGGVYGQNNASGSMDALIGVNLDDPNSVWDYAVADRTSGLTLRSTVHSSVGYSSNVVLEARNAYDSTIASVTVQNSPSTGRMIQFSHTPVVGSGMAPVALLTGAAFTGILQKTTTQSGIYSDTIIALSTAGALASATNNDYLYIFHITDNEMGIGVGDSAAWRTLVLQPYGGTVDVRAYLHASNVGYDWSSLTPGGGWNNYGSGNATFGVKRFGNLVSIKGVLIAAGAIASNTSIYTLASEYRPSSSRHFVCYGAAGAVRVIVGSDGAIRPQAAFATNEYLSVEITYFTGG